MFDDLKIEDVMVLTATTVMENMTKCEFVVLPKQLFFKNKELLENLEYGFFENYGKPNEKKSKAKIEIKLNPTVDELSSIYENYCSFKDHISSRLGMSDYDYDLDDLENQINYKVSKITGSLTPELLNSLYCKICFMKKLKTQNLSEQDYKVARNEYEFGSFLESL